MQYIFENIDLRVDSHELYIDGKAVEVEPQVYDLLKLFVENPGELITHDRLIDSVWDGRIVSDSAISARISALRKIIGDNGKQQKLIKTVPRKGFRFLAKIKSNYESISYGAEEKPFSEYGQAQKVKFCTSADGTQIAFATTGSGYPLVRAGHWLTHLEYDWQSPVWRPFLNELGKHYSVTRYDQRGNGLSDWDVSDLTLESFVEDLEAIAETIEKEKFALYGTSQGVPIAVAYAVKHPERVSHLILHGGYVRGRFLRAKNEELEKAEALLTLIRHGWGKPNSNFIQAFASMFIPDGTKQQLDSLTELQRVSTSPENAARIRESVDLFDVSNLLRSIKAPTLVFHAKNDGIQPFEQGKKLAGGIKDASFVMLESRNHVILEEEPAWKVLFKEISDFVSS